MLQQLVQLKLILMLPRLLSALNHRPVILGLKFVLLWQDLKGRPIIEVN